MKDSALTLIADGITSLTPLGLKDFGKGHLPDIPYRLSCL